MGRRRRIPNPLKRSDGRQRRWLHRLLIGAAATLVLLPLLLILPLRWLDPPTTAMILARTWDRWDEGRSKAYPERRTTPLSQLGALVPRAVLAAEDDAFYLHHGFDLNQLEKVVRGEPGRKRSRGASTISQQTAKNLFLWNGRSWLRKGLEAYLTVWLELLLPKDRILELYLGLVECGDGYFGIDACARHHYGKSAAQLDEDEAARLAAILPNPLKLSPGSDYAEEQAEVITERMQVPVAKP